MKNNEGVIEFVARPVGFNNQTVETKATANTFESAIYSCYLLVFDSNTGNLLQRSEASLNQNIKLNVKSGNIKACFLVNVTKTFAENIKGITRPEGSTEDPNFYLNSAVLDITYADHTVADNDTETSGIIGVPSVNFGGTIGTKKCLPMYGEWSGSVSGQSTIQVPIKRLFAKVTMNIKMQLTNVGVGQIAPSTVNYELRQYQLYNLPTKVRLVVDDSESDWVGTASAFYANAITPQSSDDNLGLQTININDSDNNSDNNSDVVKGIEFSFYVPEYYLSPKANPTQDQKCKPENYDFKNKYAIYVKLSGEVNRSLIDNTTIYHKIYLGENGTDNYTLKRNRHYINQITIMGIENNADGKGDNLDHRVTSETVNNPVANAGKAANCYIIATPGKYTIPAYKGAYNNLNRATLCMEGKNLSEYDTKVEILANVVEYESITSITFSESPTYDPQTNTISFTVDKMLTDNWVPNGSVIMALKYKKKGESTWTTEWSWHLWFVFKVGKSEDGWGAIGYQDMPGGNDKMMDRNLGVNAATSAGTKAGFYYKYGEHTPYLDPDGDGVFAQYGGGVLYGSDSKPVTAWSASKSPTDPCPPGYKVPNSDVWADSKQDYMDFGSSYFTYKEMSVSWDGVDLEAINYPYSGCLNGSSAPSSGKAFLASNHPIEYKNPLTLRDDDNTTSFDSEGTQYKLTCDVYYTYTNGAVWANNNLSLYYQKNGSRTIRYVSGQKREKKNVGKWYSPKYQWQAWETLTEAEMQSLSNGLMASVISAFLNDYKVPGDIYKNDYTGYNSYGLQVRCIKE